MNTVDSLLSRTEISETIFRYARGFDRMDLDMALSCFHADSVHDHGKFHGFSHGFCKYAMALMAEDFAPLSDMRASSTYRMKTAQNLLRRFWLETRADTPLRTDQVNAFACA